MSDTIEPLGFTYGGWAIRKDPTAGFILTDHEEFKVDEVYLDRDRLIALMALLQHTADTFKADPEDEEDEDD